MINKNNVTLFVMVTGILTFSILAMTSLSINKISAQCPTFITIEVDPNKGTAGFQTNTLSVGLSGQLQTCGEGMGNTFITIRGIDGPDKQVITDNNGFYDLSVPLSPGIYAIEAHYNGDNENDPSFSTKTVTVFENPQISLNEEPS